jgi:hypothetical protein
MSETADIPFDLIALVVFLVAGALLILGAVDVFQGSIFVGASWAWIPLTVAEPLVKIAEQAGAQ